MIASYHQTTIVVYFRMTVSLYAQLTLQYPRSQFPQLSRHSVVQYLAGAPGLPPVTYCNSIAQREGIPA
jgi:hypothetical protein